MLVGKHKLGKHKLGKHKLAATRSRARPAQLGK
jgi:hypothetical protein